MLTFIGSVQLPDSTPMTLQDLIVSAIAQRNYSADNTQNAALRAQEQARWKRALKAEGFVEPQGDVYMIDAYKNVRNGVAAAPGNWPTMAADFTSANGGGARLQFQVSRHFKFQSSFGSRVLYQASGGPVQIYLEIVAE
jgi:hypothetical protein